ncbi:hypothetical protein BDP27DRAFT_1371784 [Rhodocollybia butyracea]|uniref:Uncharacterized protein n=1 Tax=Rhodocollybia butyracea TaxID=206335 RepID=A0A9P5TXV5_9AGAR|nr:hypothetical protein BDP27DRAFT_1371784 [Rhodocollybia butyracea]
MPQHAISSLQMPAEDDGNQGDVESDDMESGNILDRPVCHSALPKKRAPNVQIEIVPDEDLVATSSKRQSPHVNFVKASESRPASSKSDSNNPVADASPDGVHSTNKPRLSNPDRVPSLGATPKPSPSHKSTKINYVKVGSDDQGVSSLSELDDTPTLNRNAMTNKADNVYLRKHIKFLIREEVKTRKMQQHFCKLLESPAPDLHQILRAIYSYLGHAEFASMFVQDMQSSNGVSETPSRPKRKEWQPPRHRPTVRVSLAEQVRLETKELMVPTLVDSDSDPSTSSTPVKTSGKTPLCQG